MLHQFLLQAPRMDEEAAIWSVYLTARIIRIDALSQPATCSGDHYSWSLPATMRASAFPPVPLVLGASPSRRTGRPDRSVAFGHHCVDHPTWRLAAAVNGLNDPQPAREISSVRSGSAPIGSGIVGRTDAACGWNRLYRRVVPSNNWAICWRAHPSASALSAPSGSV